MTTKTISFVDPQTRTWESQYGTMVSISVEFEDGTKGQINAKPENRDQRLADFTALVGKPGEFVVEDAGNWPDGNPKPFKIRDYPGKAPPPGAGGSRGYSYAEKLELEHLNQLSMNARTAIMQAVQMMAPVPPSAYTIDDVLVTAGRIYDWLQSKAPASPPQSQAGPAGGGESRSPLAPSSAPLSGAGETAGEGVEPVPENHIHVYEPAPRAGWEACTVCGNARKVA